MKSILIVSAAAATLAVAAVQGPRRSLYFTQPVSGSVWKAGTNNISWNNVCTWVSGANTIFPIHLYQQDTTSPLQVPVPNVGRIGSLDCSKAGSTKVTIPTTVPSGSLYSILVITGSDQSWSAQFTIQGSGPIPTVNTTSPASPTPVTAPNSTVTTPNPTVAVPSPTQSVALAPSPTPTGAASSVKASSAMAVAVIAAIGFLAF